MRRMAIRSRCYPLNPKRCLSELLRGIRRNFFRLSPCYGQVPYVLLTRAPVAGGSIATSPLPLDLHVLSLSLAFILSQDQTLRCCLYIFLFFFIKKSKAKTQTVCSVISFAFTETSEIAGIAPRCPWLTIGLNAGSWKLTEIASSIVWKIWLLYYFVMLQIFQCSLVAFSIAVAVSGKLCKGTTFIWISQIFLKILTFLKIWPANRSTISSVISSISLPLQALLLKSECKGRHFSNSLQIFHGVLTEF